MRVLKETVEVSDGNASATLTAGLREDEIRAFTPWALKRGVLPKGSWQTVKESPDAAEGE